MKENEMNEFNPDYATTPGEILDETLTSRGISRTKLSKLSGISEELLKKIDSKEIPISKDIAMKLEKALGVSAHIWINLYLWNQKE